MDATGGTTPGITRGFVDYLVARDGVPAPSGHLYDYLFAGDGVFIAARNDALAVRVRITACPLRGLPAIGEAFDLRAGRIPQAIWDAGVRLARERAERGHEDMLLVIYRRGRYELVLPPQERSAGQVRYTPPALPHGETIVLAIHSHHRMPAFFSGTDDRDERGLGVFAVLGRLDRERPEVILRAGVEGHWCPVPWEAVFAGDRGPFRDVGFEREEAEALPEVETAWGAASAPPQGRVAREFSLRVRLWLASGRPSSRAPRDE